jgi:hypothetical protein
MFQANLVKAVSHYPLSKLIPDSIGNEKDEGLYDYFIDSLSEGRIVGAGATFMLLEPKLFRKHLMSALEFGEFNLAALEIEDILRTTDTLILRDIHVSLAE